MVGELMKYWLMKSEPDVWSIDQQKKAGIKGAPWDGVRNYQAAKNLKSELLEKSGKSAKKTGKTRKSRIFLENLIEVIY